MPIHPLDSISRRILVALQSNGRATNQEVSEFAGLSASPCLRRTKQLESQGVIVGYVALVDPEALGLSVTAFVRVRLGVQDDQHLTRFEAAVMQFPEVMDCHLMSGEADYQLRVLVASLGEFEDFLRQKLTKIFGISEITTSFALRTVVAKTALPVTI
ncbi:transcriptional regulator, AsnC family [Sphingobium faniae]|nr:transcriptional regulator, AsnC family [Sphingobium faniae]